MAGLMMISGTLVIVWFLRNALLGVFLLCKTRWLKKDTVTNMPLIFQNSKQADES